ncbi:MAG: asparaginase domain-containing protein [Synergistaceae bacterium]|nr:asparaginase domain-containing protein [Synergistaceae bacterium]
MENKLLIISTGGTIVSVDHGNGAEPDGKAAESLLGKMAEYLKNEGISCECKSIFGAAGRDSSDISPAEWHLLSERINEAKSRGIKKILIIHGTDTMAYSAAWLSLTTEGAAVALTGSQLTPGEEGFDGDENLIGAAKALQDMESGVIIHFAGENFGGAYVHKENASELRAYTSTGKGAPPAPLPLPPMPEDWRRTASGIELVYIHPAIMPRFPADAKILILAAFGAGNMPQRIQAALSDAYPGRKPVVIAASSCAAGEKNPSRYGGVGAAGLAKKNFTLFNQGSYSLEFLIALSYLALLTGGGEPEKILALYLEKFQ